MASKVFIRATRPSVYALVKNKLYLCELIVTSIRLTGSSLLEEFTTGHIIIRRSHLLQGLAWVSYWLTFCKWSNGTNPLIP